MESAQSPQLYTVKQFAEAFPHHTEHSLRWLIARADQNGFERVIRRIGRKILLSVDEYFRWVESVNQK